MEFNLETIFWISAVVGTTFFILKTVTMFLGMGDHFNIEVDHGSDLHGLDSSGSVIAFKFLSLTGIVTFLMMFGWAGLVGLDQYSFNSTYAAIFAAIVGVVAVFVIALIFQYAMKLSSSGAGFGEADILGKHAEVYARIPAQGVGRVQLHVGGLLRELDAVSSNQQEIPSYQKVEVVKMIDSNTVEVKVLIEEIK